MSEDASASCETIIRNGMVIDGGGGPRVRADVAVTDGRITAVGELSAVRAEREIDAAGRIVAPGFIDTHTHDDRALLSSPDMAMKVSQGVTTVVVGNCGISLSPLEPSAPPPPPMDILGDRDWYRFPTVSAYRARLEATPPALNVAMLIGHSTLRLGVMDDVGRAASESEIARMREKLGEGMAAGAVGFSTGLSYAPNRAAPTDEIVALAEVAARFGGLYVTHMRNEGDTIDEALDEAFEIGERAALPIIVSHYKCAGAANFGRSQQTLARIEEARGRQRVGLDVYPYAAGSTVLIPDLVEDSARVIMTWSTPKPEVAGRDLGDLAAEWGCSPRAAAEALVPGGAIYFMMDEDDVRRILAYPHTMIGSDGLPHDVHPHPRLWGTFPRVLGHYARELGLITLEDAVHKMTGLPAAQFGLAGRGVVRAGAHADLVVFDPAAVIDCSSYENPTAPAAGIEAVMVNGCVVWSGLAASGEHPGRILERTAPAS